MLKLSLAFVSKFVVPTNTLEIYTYPQHEILSLPDPGGLLQETISINISPVQKRTLGHGIFTVLGHL